MKNCALLLVMFMVISGCAGDSSQRCEAGLFKEKVKIANRHFQALLTQMGKPTFWIDGCNVSYGIHPGSHSILRSMRLVAAKAPNGVAFSGFLDGEFIYLDDMNRSVILINNMHGIHAYGYDMRVILESRMANERVM